MHRERKTSAGRQNIYKHQKSMDVKRKRVFRSRLDWLLIFLSSPAAFAGTVTLCLWAESSEMHGPCHSRGPGASSPKQPYNSARHLHSGAIHHTGHSHRYGCLRLRTPLILKRNSYNSAQLFRIKPLYCCLCAQNLQLNLLYCLYLLSVKSSNTVTASAWPSPLKKHISHFISYFIVNTIFLDTF